MAHRAGLSAAATLARAPGRCCRSPCRRRRPTTWIDVRGYPEGRSSRRVAVLSRLISRVVVLACQLRPHAWSPTVRAHWLTVTLSSADSGRTLSYSVVQMPARIVQEMSTAILSVTYRISSELRSQATAGLVSTTVGDHVGIRGAVGSLFFFVQVFFAAGCAGIHWSRRNGGHSPASSWRPGGYSRRADSSENQRQRRGCGRDTGCAG